jgi:undecaprenyl-diphosphatase
MNRWLFYKLYNAAVKSGAVRLAALIAHYSQGVFVLIYIVGLVLVGYNSFTGDAPLRLAVSYVAYPFIAIVLNASIRKLAGRERPFMRENVKSYIEHDATGSFPSNHAASAMVIAVSWFCVIRCYCVGGVAVLAELGLVVLALITGLSRIMVGVHYPADVAVGWLIGGFFGAVCIATNLFL